jgi:hypothetical protein
MTVLALIYTIGQISGPPEPGGHGRVRRPR